MPDEKTAQATPQAGQSFEELFSKGWDEVVEPAQAAAPKAAEDDCPDCPPPGTESKDRKPIRILKHQGKEVPVYSQRQLDDLAQQGFDYTKKRQIDSEERRKWEADFEARQNALMEQASRLDAIIKASDTKTGRQEAQAPAPASAAGIPATEGPEDENSILQSYGVDPEYATDNERKVALKLHASEKSIKQVEQVAQIMLINEVFRRVTSAIDEAQKEYPIEDVKNEKGESVTQKQIMDIFRDKVGKAENKHRPIQELARETIKEIHTIQRPAEPAGGRESLEDLSLDEIARRYPKLYAKISGGNSGDDLPPSMDRTSRAPSRDSRQMAPAGKHRFKSLEEALEAGFRDSETIKALSGG